MKTSNTLDRPYKAWNPFVDVSFGNPELYGQAEEGERMMTVGGTVRTALLLVCVAVAGGIFGWSLGIESNIIGLVLILIGGFAAVTAAYKPKIAAPASVLFAAAEGAFVGISATQGRIYLANVTITAAVVVTVMVVLYGGGLLRSTSSVVKVIAGAAGGVGFVYAVELTAKALGVDFSFTGHVDLLGAVVSIVVAGLAAANLLSVFNAIELLSDECPTKDAQWAGASGLLFTASWAQLEMYRLVANLIVRLISKVRAALAPE